MSDILQVRHKGLWTSPNPFSEVPQGALLVADNCVIDANGILESRRGFLRLSAFGESNFRASRYYSYQSTILSCFGPTADQWGGSVGYFDGSDWQTYSGTYYHPDNNLARIRFLEAASNVYWTSSTGVYKLDSPTNSPVLAGQYGALDLTGTIDGTSGFFTNNPVVTITATTTNLSSTLKALSAIDALQVGQYISGTGISAGTTVSAITNAALVLQTTGNTSAGSNTISVLAQTAGLAVGQVVLGTNIPSNTTVTATTAASNVLTTTGTTAAGSASLSSLASTTGLAVGQLITMSGVPANTYVVAIASTTVTMSNTATLTGSSVSVTFATPPSCTLSASATSTLSGGIYQFLSPATVTMSNAASASGSVSLTFSTGSQVGYRVLWGIKDANKNILLGSPSNRAVVINNSGSTCNVSLDITIPTGITLDHFFQVYRTAMSPSASIDPGDEPQLVYEGNPTSSDLSNGYITVIDIVPDSLRGAALYTNDSQEGISQSNERPPLCWDMTNYQNYTFYANTTSKQRLSLTIIAAGGDSGIQVGDTLTLAGTTYTAASSEDSSTGQFQVFTSGTPSQNIADTALSLVRVINQYSSNTSVYASYLSGVNDLPGMISVFERGIGGATFYATASDNGTAYNPALPTSGTSVPSDNQANKNGLMYSKEGQPEAVPLSNILYVGSANYRIYRILPLRESLFIFKEQEGIFQLTGLTSANFSVRKLDSSAHLIAPDSAVVLSNQVWCLTDQGISIVSETGTQVASRPIENLILDAFGASLSGVANYSSGISYETDRKYILLTTTGASDTAPTQAFVFNTFTQAFTRWPISKTCGFVNPLDDKLYLGDALSSYTNQERKNRNYTDYVDEGTSYSISSFSGQFVFLSSNGIQIGDRLWQSASVQSLIIDVQPGYVKVLDSLSTWTAGDCTVYKAIDCLVEYAPVTGGNAGLLKQLPEISFLFRQSQFYTVNAGFATDISPAFESVALFGSSIGSWGLFPWGGVPWGGVSQPKPIQTYIPLEKQLSGQLRVRFEHRQGFGIWKLEGFDIPIAGGTSTVVGW